MTFARNIKEAFNDESKKHSDDGDIVQTLLIIGAFAIVVIVTTLWISTAFMNKGADLAGCIEGVQIGDYEASLENCNEQEHASIDGKSFKDNDEYSSRYDNE